MSLCFYYIWWSLKLWCIRPPPWYKAIPSIQKYDITKFPISQNCNILKYYILHYKWRKFHPNSSILLSSQSIYIYLYLYAVKPKQLTIYISYICPDNLIKYKYLHETISIYFALALVRLVWKINFAILSLAHAYAAFAFFRNPSHPTHATILFAVDVPKLFIGKGIEYQV